MAWLLVATFAKDLATKFHKHGRWFYKMKEKLALTKDDIAERLAWFLVAAFTKDLATKSLGSQVTNKKAITRARVSY